MPLGGLEPQPLPAPGSDATSAPATVVVSDAGPLIALGRLDLIGLLKALFTGVQVPEAVIRECLARPGNADALRIRQALDQGHLVVCPNPLQTLAGLDVGESAAIAHAVTIGAAVLLDERAGRQRALAMGLMATGTPGALVRARQRGPVQQADRAGHRALVRARQRGLIGPIGPLVAALRASGQRLRQPAVLHALAAVGETVP